MDNWINFFEEKLPLGMIVIVVPIMNLATLSNLIKNFPWLIKDLIPFWPVPKETDFVQIVIAY